MHVEIFTLCDAATNQSGKLNILGTFDVIWVKKIPVNYPQCSIAFKIRFEPGEAGEHNFAIHIVDIDGKHIMPPLNKKLNVVFPQNQSTYSANFVLNLHGLKLEKLGEYEINLALDGQQVASLPLYVKEQAPKPINT